MEQLSTFFDEQAERSVLAHFLSGEDVERYSGELVADDFYNQDHKRIFEAIRKLAVEKKDVDLVTVKEELKTLFEDGRGLGKIARGILSDDGGFAAKAGIKQHIEIVKAMSLRRQLFNTLDGARAELQDETNDTLTVLDSTRQKLRDMVGTGSSWMSMDEVLMQTFGAIEKRAKGEEHCMPSGIEMLDKCTTGFHKGELTILGARPAVGKSALGSHIALSAANAGYKVGIVSREMTPEQYGQRIFVRGSGVDNNKMRKGEINDDEWDHLIETMEQYGTFPISFMFSTRYIEDLRMEVQKKIDTEGLDLLIVDYVQLMQSKRKFEKDYMRIAYVSKMLKDMTVDLNLAIIGLAQVGREADGDMPTMAELRGSGDLEQDADNIIFMHRPKNSKDKSVRAEDSMLVESLSEDKQYIVLDVAKQRQGETGRFALIFTPNKMLYQAVQR